MAPQQHLVISWVLSNLNRDIRRDRIFCTLCGVVADIDGLGIIIDAIRGDKLHTCYCTWHHLVTHNILTLLIIGTLAYFVCSRKILPVVIAIVTYLTHLLFDLVGSGCADGTTWPMWPFWPFSRYEIDLSWQWPLNDYKNVLITAIFVVIMLVIAAKNKRSLLEVVSPKLDRYCIDVIERLLRREK